MKEAKAETPGLREFRERCIKLAIELTGPISNYKAEVPAIHWLYDSPYSEEQIVQFFHQLDEEAHASNGKFKATWCLVKSKIGGRFRPPKPISEEVSSQLRRDIETLDALDERSRIGLAAFSALPEEKQRILIERKRDEFFSGQYAAAYKRFADQELADRIIYEISKELGARQTA